MTTPSSPDEPRALLDELRSATIQRGETARDSFDSIVQATSDVATDDEHDPEGHTIAWERQQIASLLEETKVVLAAIDAAEERLDAGQYGICTSCGREISEGRLDALPATPTCVDCAR